MEGDQKIIAIVHPSLVSNMIFEPARFNLTRPKASD
jgi:hypothetical protein